MIKAILMQDHRRVLEISMDDETGFVVLTVMDRERREVIRQMTLKQVLRLMEGARGREV
ncbi:hypothetical protein CCR95_08550 [Thiocystis minor]|uniref:flagellar protein FlaG n=1 Tax=Thiocystis minor TaxID=61597 RepID=UPI001914BCB5|nr:flagellar protein FlaG [Thiocystis minor]MBK5964133.1 hypothetical protein [Thiocystis minor]